MYNDRTLIKISKIENFDLFLFEKIKKSNVR